MGCALLTFGSYFAFPSAASTLFKNSDDAVMSYHAPSLKSTSALPLQLTVTTRPTRSPNRFSSGRSLFARTYWSVHSARSASIRAGDGFSMATLYAVKCLPAARRGRREIELLDELARLPGPEFARHPFVPPVHRQRPVVADLVQRADHPFPVDPAAARRTELPPPPRVAV